MARGKAHKAAGVLVVLTALALMVPCTTAWAGGGIDMQMTVAVDETPGDTSDDVCGVKERLAVSRGTHVDVCYEVTNNTGSSLTRHDLTDSQFGTILDDFPFTLVSTASAFITQSKKMKRTTRFKARWVAGGTASIETDTDVTRVKVRR